MPSKCAGLSLPRASFAAQVTACTHFPRRLLSRETTNGTVGADNGRCRRPRERTPAIERRRDHYTMHKARRTGSVPQSCTLQLRTRGEKKREGQVSVAYARLAPRNRETDSDNGARTTREVDFFPVRRCFSLLSESRASVRIVIAVSRKRLALPTKLLQTEKQQFNAKALDHSAGLKPSIHGTHMAAHKMADGTKN